MNGPPKILAMGFAALCLASGVAHAMSAATERAETRKLNQQQSVQAQQSNDAQRIASVTDASAPGAPPAAVPTHALQIGAASPLTDAPTGMPAQTADAPKADR